MQPAAGCTSPPALLLPCMPLPSSHTPRPCQAHAHPCFPCCSEGGGGGFGFSFPITPPDSKQEVVESEPPERLFSTWASSHSRASLDDEGGWVHGVGGGERGSSRGAGGGDGSWSSSYSRALLEGRGFLDAWSGRGTLGGGDACLAAAWCKCVPFRCYVHPTYTHAHLSCTSLAVPHSPYALYHIHKQSCSTAGPFALQQPGLSQQSRQQPVTRSGHVGGSCGCHAAGWSGCRAGARLQPGAEW